MRRILFSLFTLSFSISNAQSWVNVGGGVTGETVLALYPYHGLLYAGGVFYMANGKPMNYIGTWDGTKWDTLGEGITQITPGSTREGVVSILGYDSILYVGGQFDSAENMQTRSIAQWNGTSWDSLDMGITNIHGQNVDALAFYKGKLYASGNFSSYGSGIINFAIWNGSKWDSVPGANMVAYSMVVFNGYLYVAGAFNMASGVHVNNIAKWDGTKWDSLGNGITGAGYVSSLCVCNNKLYAGGSFSKAGGSPANNIAVWDGSNWSTLGLGTDADIEALVSFNGILYAGGVFSNAGGTPANEIAEWDGLSWFPIGAGFQGGTFGVQTLAFYDSVLYAGGGFTKSGSTSLNYIAQWNGPLGVNEVQGNREQVLVFPNPSEGKFTFQLGISNEQLGIKNTVEIYNELGQKVYSQFSILNPQFSIDISNQPSGIYFYRVTTQQGELVGSGKLTIE
ncbi:MAG TPA: T9SS type A sorting domain-containing protein [Bacteroidia bacterium]|jgi:hypothetical protein|nr:T9SS type A sorting domain-containing protein [Bacteroidia bacterium]